nr:MAG TPA: hypothetical protein [Crassvirales sp.]
MLFCKLTIDPFANVFLFANFVSVVYQIHEIVLCK